MLLPTRTTEPANNLINSTHLLLAFDEDDDDDDDDDAGAANNLINSTHCLLALTNQAEPFIRYNYISKSTMPPVFPASTFNNGVPCGHFYALKH